MVQRRKAERPGRGVTDHGRTNGQTDAGAFLSTSILPQDARQNKTQTDQAHAPPRDTALIAALERARCDYWQAWDRHEYSQADAHAAHYRALLRRAYLGAGLDNRLRQIERVMLEQDARLDALELGEVLGEGVHDD